MRPNRDIQSIAALCTLLLHVAVMLLASGMPWSQRSERQPVPVVDPVVVLQFVTPVLARAAEVPLVEAVEPMSTGAMLTTAEVPGTPTVPAMALAHKSLAIQSAPPPPSTEEWAFAARYTHKNSKGYRYSWGQQVRSMMGTAVEGPDQGGVRFRVEIAPDGRLARLETLWTTSAVAEERARKAIETLPALPPTPTGEPLVFERTISFTPFATDGPPSYRDDCLPETPAFRNPFAWDGRNTPAHATPVVATRPDPKALEECLRQLPQDSVGAEMARDQRLMERWRWK